MSRSVLRAVSGDCTSSEGTKTAWRSASAASSARRPAPRTAFYIEAAENTSEERISAGERYAEVYNIDYNRCIFCGYCVEACPTDAIVHGHDFEIAAYNVVDLVYRKERLLEAFPGRPTPSKSS